MAFSMDQIQKTKQQQKIVDTHKLFGWISSLQNVSDETRLAIYTYLQTRLEIFGKRGLGYEIFKFMIQDLLQQCCKKDFIEITPEDTIINFSEIIFQLKWSIKRCIKDKRTLNKHTIYISTDIENIERKRVDTIVPKRAVFTDTMSSDEILTYLKERLC